MNPIIQDIIRRNNEVIKVLEDISKEIKQPVEEW